MENKFIVQIRKISTFILFIFFTKEAGKEV